MSEHFALVNRSWYAVSTRTRSTDRVPPPMESRLRRIAWENVSGEFTTYGREELYVLATSEFALEMR